MPPKLDRKAALTQIWGRAKREFIARQIAEGSSTFNANALWLVRRRHLADLNVHKPQAGDLETYKKGNRGQYEEAEDDVGADIESSDPGGGAYIDAAADDKGEEGEVTWDNQAYELKGDKEPEGATGGHIPTELELLLTDIQAYKAKWDKKEKEKVAKKWQDPLDQATPYTSQELRQLELAEQAINNPKKRLNTAPLFQAPARKKQELDKAVPVGKYHDISASSSEHTHDTFLTDSGLDTPGSSKSGPSTPQFTDQSDTRFSSTDYSPNSNTETLTDSIPDRAEMSNGSPVVFAKTPSDGGDDNMDGGGAPGNNATRGQGGTGGGLAGAGNNTLFNGFAGSTKPKDGEYFCYTDTYKRPFAIHSEFPTVDYTAGAAHMLRETQQTPDKGTALDEGYPSDYIEASCDHGGVFFPYWMVEASMKAQDWNKPNDHIGYEVVEYGFNVPNLRLSIMNNDRTEVTQVAPAPPADARMWIFVDTHNDYGLVRSYATNDVSHSNYFTEEDIIVENYERYQLPALGPRYFMLEPTVALHILQDRDWSGDDSSYFAYDPNSLYDMKRHPGYKEFILSEASIGMKYSPKSPMIRFPHPPQGSMDMTMRQSNLGQNFSCDASTDVAILNMWQNVTAPLIDTNTNTSEDDVLEDAMFQFYCSNLSAYTKDLLTTDPIAGVEKSARDMYGSLPMRAPVAGSVSLPLATSNIRSIGRYDINDEGSFHCSHVSKRPPIICIGVHKELEDQSDGPKFWRYYCYGQVEYTCRIKWHVDRKLAKPYLPIGLGGFYTEWTSGLIDMTQVGRRQQLAARKNWRRTMFPHGKSTAYERPELTYFPL